MHDQNIEAPKQEFLCDPGFNASQCWLIRKKTASLIAASCAAGAASVTDDKEMIERFYKFGETIGIAFQIKDDLFDYGDADVGKPRAIDISEKKMTLT